LPGVLESAERLPKSASMFRKNILVNNLCFKIITHNFWLSNLMKLPVWKHGRQILKNVVRSRHGKF
jgi:hypothetical protein